MELSEVAAKFLNSDHGRKAVEALGAHGISLEDAQSHLSHASVAAAQHVNDHHESKGLFGSHPGRNFFAAFAAGIVKGDGVFGALEDGAMGVVTGRIAEALVDKAGLDGDTAGTIAAAATPFIVDFIKSEFTR